MDQPTNYVKKLKEWELIDSKDVVKLTEDGKIVLKIVGKEEKYFSNTHR